MPRTSRYVCVSMILIMLLKCYNNNNDTHLQVFYSLCNLINNYTVRVQGFSFISSIILQIKLYLSFWVETFARIGTMIYLINVHQFNVSRNIALDSAAWCAMMKKDLY